MRKTQDHADVGFLVVADQLECCRTAFALMRHLAHADLVADHFDGLIALDCLPALLLLLLLLNYKIYLKRRSVFALNRRIVSMRKVSCVSVLRI